MQIALFTPAARLALALLAVACAVAAVVLGRLRRGSSARGIEVGFVATTVTAIAGLAVLACEKLVALAVAGDAPADAGFNEWRWVLAAPWGTLGIALGVAAVLATLYLCYRGTARERLSRRALLVTLRAGACAAALVLFLEPAVELRHVTREPNHIAILVDDSRSMQLAERRSGPTRAERAAALISDSAATFEAWRREHLIDFFTFSSSLLPAGGAQLEHPVAGRGDATLLRDALESVRARYDSHDLAGVIVISDGIATGRFADGVEDGAAQDFLADLGVKVYTAWAGRDGLEDVAVARVRADDFAFVRTAMKIEAVVRATGIEEQELPVTLRRDGQPIKQTTVRVGGHITDARVTFGIVPDRVGKYVYEIAVPVLRDEAVTTNNTRSFVVRVTRDKTRVLQVVGRPSWDERALRAFFKADPNVDLISFFILRTRNDLYGVPTEELSLIPFPTRELFEDELGSFDVIILQNFAYGEYRIDQYLENIRAYTEAGGALVMIGGDESFSSGGYYGTPVADALPVELTYGDPSHLLSTEEFHARLTEDGRRHPITQLRFERRDNVARWAGLPALEGLNFVAGPKPGATVLLEHPTLRTRTGRPMPVLVAGEYGKGRTLALLTDSAWRWGFVAAGREGDDGRAYQKLWENAVRWLIKDPELEYLHIEADQAEYHKGAVPRLTVRLVDKDYRPARAQPVSVQVVPIVLAGKSRRAPPAATAAPVFVKVVTTDDTGVAAVDTGALAPGSYRALAQAKLEPGRATQADDVFDIAPEREELEHPAARQDLLAGIAKATGGRYLGTAGALPPDLELAPPRVVRVDRRSDVEVWSQPHLLLLALAFLGAEWALRRRRGFL